jgi:alcohol dehydrogenase (cytochrome c)
MNRYFAGLVLATVALALVITTQRGVEAKPVTDADLAAPAGNEWLHGNGNIDGTRYSTLTQLTPANAGSLKVKWIAALGGKTDAQATPIYHDGVVIIPQDNRLNGFDAKTGRLLWRYETEMPEDWGGQFVDFFTGKHRMAAIAGENAYYMSNECTLHAVNYKTGAAAFKVKVNRPYPKDFKKSQDGNGYFCTAGLLAIPGGKLIVPMNATDTGGLQGYVEAYSQADGKLLWAANMIPGPGEPGADTWPGNSREYGGAGPWIVGSWDAESKTYFTGTANAYPWNPYTERDGRGAGNMQNVGAAAIVAVNTDTGKVQWRYTVVPGDPWDYDAMQTPMLATIDGKRTIVQPNKTGYIHFLDAKTGKFLQAPQFADKITWAKGYDSSGAPMWDFPVPAEGTTVEVWPSLLGGVNMYPNAINPKTGMIYLARREASMSYVAEKVQVVSNVRNLGVSFEILPGGKEVESANDLKSGKEKWRYETAKAGYSGGMMTTAGGLTVWATQGGELTVADASSGKVVWQLNANTTSKSGPMTYVVDGKQQITFALGGTGGFGSVTKDWNNVNQASILVTIGQ